jgi:hypothetical protein
VRHAGGPDQDLSGPGLDCRLANGEPCPARSDDENLVLGMDMRAWAFADLFGGIKQDGDARANVFALTMPIPEPVVLRPVGTIEDCRCAAHVTGLPLARHIYPPSPSPRQSCSGYEPRASPDPRPDQRSVAVGTWPHIAPRRLQLRSAGPAATARAASRPSRPRARCRHPVVARRWQREHAGG